MEKLELKHIAPYLPYSLKMLRNGFVSTLIAVKNDKESIAENYEFQVSCSNWWENSSDVNYYKPILRPLSDLTKEITHNGKIFVPIEIIKMHHDIDIDSDGIVTDSVDEFGINWLPYEVTQFLFKWHFDFFRLIEKGLAIDINTLTQS